MKKCARFYFLVLFILSALGFGGNAGASLNNKTIDIKILLTKQEKGGEEYLNIFATYLKTRKPVHTYYWAVKRLTISKYIRFIDEYPLSEFVAEAKLRIAEFYDVIRQTHRAKRWLDDIIKNHPDDDYYTIKVHYKKMQYARFELLPSKEKTAAWALYYRAAWFPGKNNSDRITDLKKILKQYGKKGKVSAIAKEALQKYEKGKVNDN